MESSIKPLRGELARAALEGAASRLACEFEGAVGDDGLVDVAALDLARTRFAGVAEHLLDLEDVLDRLPAPEPDSVRSLEDYLRGTLVPRALALIG